LRMIKKTRKAPDLYNVGQMSGRDLNRSPRCDA
jgi:hypothetical protein